MQIWEAAVLGLLQGLTEFLPISSSAHLRIAGEFLPSGADPGAAFTAITQIGTELAVLIYFREDLMRIATAMIRQTSGVGGHVPEDARMGWLIVLGSLPIVVLGLLFSGAIETSLRSLYIVATTLVVFGIILGFADRYGRRRKPLAELSWRDGLLLGFAQAMALIPGVSRSGGTITAALMLGFTREAAARYSFLLAVPAVFGSGFYQLAKSWGEPQHVALAPTIVATAVAFLVGYIVIVAFLKIVSRASFMPFVIYRTVLGIALLALLQLGVITP
ncbi:undecaprenyl-diphosphate phosphatase [Azospirillum argentinense]|uniref:Undecaprenyl-diphosphatase n=1 Tax=Azospirillum argentinense TaxID=2970906 RepID=A0A5B0KN33_9PROT|nr:undecaprenyl-diphosphate phosphatase [Azospirillum argentinense]KAA1054087.1 Undecaprenyl-diphosphatase [Azospirillum argentinense]